MEEVGEALLTKRSPLICSVCGCCCMWRCVRVAQDDEAGKGVTEPELTPTETGRALVEETVKESKARSRRTSTADSRCAKHGPEDQRVDEWEQEYRNTPRHSSPHR